MIGRRWVNTWIRGGSERVKIVASAPGRTLGNPTVRSHHAPGPPATGDGSDRLEDS